MSKPSKDHQGQASALLDADHWWQKIPSRTPKRNLLQSWAHEPEDSKTNPLVCACKRHAKREPSLIVVVSHVSWLMASLLALIRQKQLAKSSPQARHVSSKTAFLNGTSILPRPSQKVLPWAKMGPQETTCKNKFSLYGPLCTPLEACLQRTLLWNEY